MLINTTSIVTLATFIRHIVDLNIDRYDMIIGRDLIKSLDIEIHGGDMTIHWDDAAITWSDIDSTAKDVFALS